MLLIDMFLLKNERNSPTGNICQKRHSERLYIDVMDGAVYGKSIFQ